MLSVLGSMRLQGCNERYSLEELVHQEILSMKRSVGKGFLLYEDKMSVFVA